MPAPMIIAERLFTIIFNLCGDDKCDAFLQCFFYHLKIDICLFNILTTKAFLFFMR